VKIAYLNKEKNKRMEKRFRGVILGQIFTLNHPSSMDQEVGKKKKL
jgi:hypothetical protein